MSTGKAHDGWLRVPRHCDCEDCTTLASPEAEKRTVSHYLLEVAKLGGYLARMNDPPPGNMVVWRGLTRLTDLCLGFELKDPVVDN